MGPIPSVNGRNFVMPDFPFAVDLRRTTLNGMNRELISSISSRVSGDDGSPAIIISFGIASCQHRAASICGAASGDLRTTAHEEIVSSAFDLQSLLSVICARR